MFHSILRTCILLAGKTCSLYVYPTIHVQNLKRSGFSLVGRWQIKEAKASNDINAEALDGGPIAAGRSEEIKKKWPQLEK